jgi:hypothetical protein
MPVILALALLLAGCHVAVIHAVHVGVQAHCAWVHGLHECNR